MTLPSKVALKPGHSLMDWIRFAKSGKDLTGLRGRLIEVTEEELRKHNRREDCWTCIRGESAEAFLLGENFMALLFVKFVLLTNYITNKYDKLNRCK